jgi:hypothetical protein
MVMAYDITSRLKQKTIEESDKRYNLMLMIHITSVKRQRAVTDLANERD